MATADDSKLGGNTWTVVDDLCSNNMHGVLNHISTVVVFPCNRQEGKSESVTNPVNLHQLDPSSWLTSKEARKLVNEAVSTFVSLQEVAKETGTSVIRPSFLVKKCREYRAMIQACLEDIESGVETSAAEESTELEATCQLLYKMELVLSLVEIVFIDERPGGVILGQLLDWIRQHFPQSIQKMEEALALERPFEHPAYWEAVYGLVLQGRMEETRHLLSTHGDASTDPFLSMDEILRKMPVYQVYGGISESEFKVRWHHWQSECERRQQECHFTACNQLQTVCQMLCGDVDVLVRQVDVMETWYHLMVSTLLFSNPTAKRFTIQSAAEDAINRMGGLSRITALDSVLLAAVELDAHKVIKQSQEVLDNSWFTSHITDLLCHALGMKMDQMFLDLRESLLIDYASVLAGHKSLWQVGVLYLDHCGVVGQAMIEHVLLRIPLTDDSKAHKVIQLAEDRNLEHIIVSVCRVMGRQALRQQRLGAAVWWGVRSKDSGFTSHLAHQILQHYIEKGHFESAQLLAHLGPAMLLSDALTFLGKYREFHMLYQDGNFKAASELLISLISSKLAPEYFWPVLLVDALPLLKCEEPVVTANQTYELLYCLHNLKVEAKPSENPDLRRAASESFEEKKGEIRLALTTNLARSIICEGSIQQ
ncbi:nuclear pore complex protein Nup75 [Oratosquilla oratoria]|uniref:nuclear pore complex protein Nup75 n=1 Tax=Oratosquilla oratoria TaxID=337810 RepID=UPI003F76F962